MNLTNFFKAIDNDDYVIVDEQGNDRELTPLLTMCDVVEVNIYNDTVYITVR